MYVALAGGVGGARLAYGLSRAIASDRLLVAVNVGDDFRHFGLAICPDLDTVCYTLGERDDALRGWGRTGETWHFMRAMRELGSEEWFQLGDQDLALHVLRTQALQSGMSLGAFTARICERFAIPCRVIPVSEDPIETFIATAGADLAFQDYFVRQQCKPVATGFQYRGAAAAAAHPALLDALRRPDLEAVILCPSNPWLSIGPMLAIPGLRHALAAASAPVIAVSPIVSGKAIKGPAAKLMGELGLVASSLEVARHYQGLIDGFVIDAQDVESRPSIEALDVRVMVTDTIMSDRDKRIQLARAIVEERWR